MNVTKYNGYAVWLFHVAISQATCQSSLYVDYMSNSNMIASAGKVNNIVPSTLEMYPAFDIEGCGSSSEL